MKTNKKPIIKKQKQKGKQKKIRYASYIPHGSPSKDTIARSDQMVDNYSGICMSIMCYQFAHMQEIAGTFAYNNFFVQQFTIVGKLRSFKEGISELKRQFTTLEIQDQTGKLSVNVFTENPKTDWIQRVLLLNELTEVKNLIGKYLKVCFKSKRPIIKKRAVIHTCSSIQLITDFDDITKHKLHAILDHMYSLTL